MHNWEAFLKISSFGKGKYFAHFRYPTGLDFLGYEERWRNLWSEQALVLRGSKKNICKVLSPVLQEINLPCAVEYLRGKVKNDFIRDIKKVVNSFNETLQKS